MKFSTACLLYFVTTNNPVANSFFVGVKPRTTKVIKNNHNKANPLLLQAGGGGSSLLKLNAETTTTETDEYDDWYADFDPSDFQQYDKQDDDGYGGYSNSRNSGHDYTRDTSRDNSNVDLEEVNNMISERLDYRKTGRFQEADSIRDTLLEKHGVLVYDKDRTWRSGGSPGGSGGGWLKDKRRGGGRGGRGGQRGSFKTREFGPNGHDYNLSTEAGPNSSSFSDEEIHQRLADRLECKLNRRYQEADAIQNELNEGGVFVNDGSKHWRADGQPFEGYSPRRYEQSTFSSESDDVDEIQKLVGQRAKAKSERLFQRADEIRDTLREEYDVWIDDKKQQWSVGGDFGGYGKQRGGRERKFEPFSMSPYSEIPDDMEEVQRLVELRDTARAERNFDVADEIRDDLVGRNIYLDDKQRQWSVGGSGGGDRDRGGAARTPIEYSMSPGSTMPEDYEDIQRLVHLRSQARLERNFDEADEIRNELLDRDVVINDRAQQWSIGGSSNSAEAKGFDSPFTRRGGGDISQEDEEQILALLGQRDECKRDRHFQSADRIRDQLREEFQVGIDDRNREWHLLTAGYLMSIESAQLSDDVEKMIQEKIDTRARAKINKDYDVADAIRDQLQNEFNVSIDDRTKEWRVYNADNNEDDVDSVEELDEYSEDDDDDDDMMLGSDAEEPSIENDDDDIEDDHDNVDTKYTHEELAALTIPLLKEKLREADLPVSGNKAELVERLMG